MRLARTGAVAPGLAHPLWRFSCPPLPRLAPLLLVLFSVSLLPSATRAQITGISTPVQEVGHDYIKMLNETVNPSNGSVTIRIEVPVPPGRRLTLPFSFNYNSSSAYTPQGTGGGGGYMQPTNLYLSQDGWSYGLPLGSNMLVSNTPPGSLTCYASAGYTFLDSAGTQYSFGNLIGFESAPRMCVGDVNRTTDNADFYSASITGFGSPMTVSSLDNTTYTFNVGSGDGCGTPGTVLPATIEDRNGNIVSISATSCGGSFAATDTLGRTVLSSSGFGASGNTITVSGLGEPYILTWGTVSPTYSPGSTLVATDGSCNSSFGGPRGSLPVVTVLALPNGQQYTFSYDPIYGFLNKITYPNGGYISYTWALNSRSDFAAVEDFNGAPQQCGFTYDTPALTHRYVSFDGSTIAEQQDFTNYTTTWNPNNRVVWTAKTVTVTTHDLINGTSFQTNYTYSPVSVELPPSSAHEIIRRLLS